MTLTEEEKARDLAADLRELEESGWLDHERPPWRNYSQRWAAALRRALAAEDALALQCRVNSDMQHALRMTVTDCMDGDPVVWCEGIMAEQDRLRSELEGVKKANLLLMKGMESQCDLYDDAKQEVRRLQKIVERLAERVSQQSELLQRKAEK